MQLALNILTIAAFVMTTVTWIFSVVKNIKRLNLRVIDYRKDQTSAKFYVLLENKSHSSMSISSIQIIEANQYITCHLEPVLVKSILENGIKYETKTAIFPINLNPRESINCYLYFPEFQEISLAPDKKVDFQICSNRGRKKKSVILGQQSRYLHLKKHHHNV